MGEMRTITVDVPVELLDRLLIDAEGVALDETVREALDRFANAQAWARLDARRGAMTFGISYEDLRAMDDDEPY